MGTPSASYASSSSTNFAPSFAASPMSTRPASCMSTLSTMSQISESTRKCSADVHTAWQRYDAACARLDGGITKGIRLVEVPWPPAGNVCGFLPADGPSIRKQKLRRALLRWHPDKWHKALEVSPDRLELAAKLAQITQQIL